MQEIIKNIATAFTLLVAFSLPLYTMLEAWNVNDSKQKMLSLDNRSVLELPMVVEGASSNQLENLENLNTEMNGMIRVFSISSPIQN